MAGGGKAQPGRSARTRGFNCNCKLCRQRERRFWTYFKEPCRALSSKYSQNGSDSAYIPPCRYLVVLPITPTREPDRRMQQSGVGTSARGTHGNTREEDALKAAMRCIMWVAGARTARTEGDERDDLEVETTRTKAGQRRGAAVAKSAGRQGTQRAGAEGPKSVKRGVCVSRGEQDAGMRLWRANQRRGQLPKR